MATPTGSTAYSTAAGGSMVSECFRLTHAIDSYRLERSFFFFFFFSKLIYINLGFMKHYALLLVHWGFFLHATF